MQICFLRCRANVQTLDRIKYLVFIDRRSTRSNMSKTTPVFHVGSRNVFACISQDITVQFSVLTVLQVKWIPVCNTHQNSWWLGLCFPTVDSDWGARIAPRPFLRGRRLAACRGWVGAAAKRRRRDGGKFDAHFHRPTPSVVYPCVALLLGSWQWDKCRVAQKTEVRPTLFIDNICKNPTVLCFLTVTAK